MTDTKEILQVLPVGTRGRVRVSHDRKSELLAEFDRRGMSAMGFAAWAGIKYPTFAYWIQQRRRAEKQAGAEGNGPRWVEATVERDLRLPERGL